MQIVFVFICLGWSPLLQSEGLLFLCSIGCKLTTFVVQNSIIMTKILITGGGTGGHIFPAIAIADAIKAKRPDAQIRFVGANGKMEMERVPKAGYEIEGITIAGVQRQLTLTNILKNLMLPFKLVSGLLSARAIVARFEPDVVVGTGGYVSGPVVRIAGMMQVPTLIQEQNSYAGVTNKLLAQRARLICVAYPGMEQYFDQDKIKFTGNPVRSDLLQLNEVKDAAYQAFGLNPLKKTIVILGGSLGARSINEAMHQSYDLLKDQTNVQVLWQCGKLYEETYKDCPTAQLEHVHLTAFVSQMNHAYAVADVVITRAGALTISELCITAKPAVLIPSPNVAEDHQTKNAMALVNMNAARIVTDADAAQKMIPEALSILQSHTASYQLSEKIKTLAKPNAAMVIAEEVLLLADSGKI
jgi:UDP-N-acetylglucosamine--N-acetylmuramyl-(pentapeptide) pyrophosphoryl-undecaprenol N-acetylglucosamine transferase